ncbi:MAG: radical SAM family heme chaperone HemW [Halanaerobiales bacterium]|nr:radical SAM family heme chaperone HemW [Halanaerobiales bacterium]
MINFLNYKEPFGLYIHIPFCKNKCNYCDFYSLKTCKNLMDKYIDNLKEEIKLYSNNLDVHKIKTIYFGGGTPSTLSSKSIKEILKTITRNFVVINKEIETTIEANPESLDKNKIISYKQAGINRISLGVQSFIDKELDFLGRIHDVEDSLNTIEIIKNYFDNYSLDLIFAIPGQTFKKFKQSLQQAIKINPPHISLYNLQIEEETPLYKKLNKNEIERISEDLDYKMYNYAIKQLTTNNYNQYEISNFAKKGYESKHNLTYWNYKPYLGLGPSAHGFNGSNRYYNIQDIKSYNKEISNCNFPVEKIVKLSKKELITERMIMGLRLNKGINIKEFKNRFGISIFDLYGNKINKLKKENLIKEDNEKITMTKKGLNLGNLVLAEFLLE